jgi:GMP synthase-like glutamine amidotransferase
MLKLRRRARVYRSEKSEIGWLPVRTNDRSFVGEGRGSSGTDVFTAPPGRRRAGVTDIGPQAFVSGRSLGLQFHPAGDARDHGGVGARAPHEPEGGRRRP